MAREPTCHGGREEPLWNVQITIVPDPDARSLRERISGAALHRGGHGAAPLTIAIAAATLAVITAAIALSSSEAARRPGAGSQRAPQAARDRGPAGVAAAYGYPSRCLSVTLDAHDPAYARADFDRGTPCGRYDGYATAVFRRAGGAWRPVLDTTSYACPVSSLPIAVQVDLDVCAGTAGMRRSHR